MSDLEAHIRRMLDLVEPGSSDVRLVVGIAGPPGSGKSTLARNVVDGLNADGGSPPKAGLLPMDGFHLDNSELDARGLRAVKGAPETFDAEAFVALVRQLCGAERDVRYPSFDRAADRTVPDAGLLQAGTPVAVVEGNYLLLADGPWADLAPLFDLKVMLVPSMEVLEARLIERWIGYGLLPEEAHCRARQNDLVNARRVLDGSGAADLVLAGGELSQPTSGIAPECGE